MIPCILYTVLNDIVLHSSIILRKIYPVLNSPVNNTGKTSENKIGVNISLYIQYSVYVMLFNIAQWGHMWFSLTFLLLFRCSRESWLYYPSSWRSGTNDGGYVDEKHTYGLQKRIQIWLRCVPVTCTSLFVVIPSERWKTETGCNLSQTSALTNLIIIQFVLKK